MHDATSRAMIKKILIGVAIAVALVVVVGGGWIIAVTQGLPSAKDLANYEPPITSRVHAGDGRLVAEFANQHRVYVPSEELPDQLVHAFISAEDKSFFMQCLFCGIQIRATQK